MEMGSTWDEKAFQNYKCVMQSEKHTNLKVMKSGLFISDNVIFGASPDGLITCDCHSNGVLEIKCTIKFWDEDPNAKHVAENLPYLEGDGKALNKQHKYYSQVQFQMGLTG